MLNFIMRINEQLDARFRKRVGFKKKVALIITEVLFEMEASDLALSFSPGCKIETDLIKLIVAYKKTYNLSMEPVNEICKETIGFIEELCYMFSENNLTTFPGNFYNNINYRSFTAKVHAAIKECQQDIDEEVSNG